MTKKKFNLDKVLNFRKQAEDALQFEFSAVKSRFDREKFLLETNKDKFRKSREKMLETQGTFPDISELILHYRYLDKLAFEIKVQEEKVKEIEGSLEITREKLHKAMKDTKVITKIKEKVEKDIRRDLNLQEQKYLDELAINKFKNSVHG